MIDFDALNFGDIFYKVESTLQPPNRISMVDSDGNTWYRYTGTGKYKYFILKYTYTGKIETKCYGDTDGICSSIEYMIKDELDNYTTIEDSEIHNMKLALTIEEANDLIIELSLTK